MCTVPYCSLFLSNITNNYPIKNCKHHKNYWENNSAVFLRVNRELFSTQFVQEDDSNKLKHAAVDKDQAHNHPDVNIRNIGNLGNILPDPVEHDGEGEDGGHPHAHPARHRALGDK